MTNAKDHAAALLGNGITALAVIASWQEQLEWGLRIFVLLVGAVSATLTLRSMIIRRRRNPQLD